MALTIGLAVGALLVAVVVGTLAHEWSHALALHIAGIGYRLEYLPTRRGGVIGTLASSPWAAVRPTLTGTEPAFALRIAALMPLSLTLPLGVLAAVGGLPTTDQPIALLACLGWLACGLPSPQDFSVVFYAHRIGTGSDANAGQQA